MNEQPVVSIVVSTRNSAQTLGTCLESIRLQTYAHIELIVVDNDSSDKTTEIAQRYTDKVFQRGPERSAQRNLALMEIAVGAIGGYIDSDMVLGPTVVSSTVEALGQQYVAAFIEERVLAAGLYGAVRRFERAAYTATTIDAVRFFQLSAFRSVGGFDETLPPGPEDWDLSLALGELGAFVTCPAIPFGREASPWPLAQELIAKGLRPDSPSVIYHDESRNSFRATVRKKAYYLDGLEAYKRKWKDNDIVANEQLSAFHRLVGVFVGANYRLHTLRNPHLYATFLFWKLLLAAHYAISNWVVRLPGRGGDGRTRRTKNP
jgi:glycosyltransferase involved in cell wall biosynthesis